MQDGIIGAARWCDWAGAGLEHCLLRRRDGGFRLEGVVITDDPSPLAAHYRVLADIAWRTREVWVSHIGGPDLHLAADGEGHWQDLLRDQPIPGLQGCLDVDIAMTPATNTLPIRRLGLQAGQSLEILAAYIPLPGQGEGPLLPVPRRQSYTCLVPDRRYAYEGLDSGFRAALDVDAAGLVLDYPEAFRRRPLPADGPHR